MNAIPTTWSFSRWNTWDTCPFQYKCKFIDKLPDPPSPAMARGDAVHKALAAHLTSPAPLPPEVTDPFQKQIVAEMKAHDQKLVEQKWAYDASWGPTGYFGKTTWLRAIADVALLYDDSSVEVIDWKTGKRYGSNDDQMELFALTTFKHFPGRTRNGVKTTLVYLDAGSEEPAEFKASDVDRLRAKWDDRAKRMLSDRQFLPRPNDKCKFCRFSRSNNGPCRFG
jgi:putative RecB family exonuclease